MAWLVLNKIKMFLKVNMDNSQGQVIKVNNLGRDEAKLREDKCYQLFLNSRTRRFATSFGRKDWKASEVRQSNRTESKVALERETIQRNWLANRATRFVTNTTNRFID